MRKPRGSKTAGNGRSVVATVKCENREEAKRLATAEASLLPNVVSKQILSVVRENHKCDQSI